MTNAEKFQKVFGYYATEMWAKPEKEFLEWINAEALEHEPTAEYSSDVISRQAAIDAVHSYFKDKLDGLPTEETEESYEVYCDIDKANAFLSDNKYLSKRIENLPSAQPEIIRCKECKHYTSVTARCEVRGKGLYLIRGMEDFCSRAERRTDG